MRKEEMTILPTIKRTFTLAAMLLIFASSASAAAKSAVKRLPWKSPEYTLIARQMPIRSALESFSVAQGIPILLSDRVTGVLSGDFKGVRPDDFLDRISAVHNLTWYYDGTALYIYTVGEMGSTLIDLRYMKASEVLTMMVELGVEDSRFPLKTASNGELIMVSGPPRYVMLVSEMIARADKLREQRTFTSVETRIFPLKHTWADNVSFSVTSPESTVTIRGIAQLLEEIMNAGAGAAPVREGAVTNETDRLSANTDSAFRPVIRPENRLNAVVVRDTVTRFPMYENLIEQLDRPQKLVEIGVTVLELSQEDALDWQMSLKVSGAKDDVEGAAGQNAANLFNSASLGGKGLAGALTYLGDDVSVSASLTALREKGKARSISRTSILTLNNMSAEMTDTQSYHARVVGTEVASLEEVSAGTKLQVKPRIVPSASTNSPDRVWLSMELQDGGFESISVDAMPMTRTSSLETQAAVLEGHSIMLAGYLRDIKESGGWGIPYLRDIPWIGWLFGGSSVRNETVQRMFILTPYVIDVTTNDVVAVQADRHRDIEREEVLDEAFDKDGIERREREAQMDFRREMRQERAEERHGRNEAMRGLEREKRRGEMERDRRDWEKWFDEEKRRHENVRDKEDDAD
ncbi:MAG: EscC/YscC/HrcC family type III secretion system outer membrane ring protein [Lentisphaerae bacterium]|nr:EscC/YscC/HrcC family type III secretion system outer membrane ring protein [Lentisphaerota bacterium]